MTFPYQGNITLLYLHIVSYRRLDSLVDLVNYLGTLKRNMTLLSKPQLKRAV